MLAVNWAPSEKLSFNEFQHLGDCKINKASASVPPIRCIRLKLLIPFEAIRHIWQTKINGERAVILFGKVKIDLHWQSLGDEALGSQRMRFLTIVIGSGFFRTSILN